MARFDATALPPILLEHTSDVLFHFARNSPKELACARAFVDDVQSQ